MSGEPIIKTGLNKKKHQESLPRGIEFVSLQIVQLRFWCVLQGSSQGQSRSANWRATGTSGQTSNSSRPRKITTKSSWKILMDG